MTGWRSPIRRSSQSSGGGSSTPALTAKRSYASHRFSWLASALKERSSSRKELSSRGEAKLSPSPAGRVVPRGGTSPRSHGGADARSPQPAGARKTGGEGAEGG